MGVAFDENRQSIVIRNNPTEKHLFKQRDDCGILFEFEELGQDLIERNNRRERTRVNHIIEHLQGILNISELGMNGSFEIVEGRT